MKRKNMKIILLLALFINLQSVLYADSIYLKSTQKIEGKIIEETDDYVKILTQDIKLTYFKDDIIQINGQKLNQTESETNYNHTPYNYYKEAARLEISDSNKEIFTANYYVEGDNINNAYHTFNLVTIDGVEESPHESYVYPNAYLLTNTKKSKKIKSKKIIDESRASLFESKFFSVPLQIEHTNSDNYLNANVDNALLNENMIEGYKIIGVMDYSDNLTLTKNKKSVLQRVVKAKLNTRGVNGREQVLSFNMSGEMKELYETPIPKQESIERKWGL